VRLFCLRFSRLDENHDPVVRPICQEQIGTAEGWARRAEGQDGPSIPPRGTKQNSRASSAAFLFAFLEVGEVG